MLCSKLTRQHIVNKLRPTNRRRLRKPHSLRRQELPNAHEQLPLWPQTNLALTDIALDPSTRLNTRQMLRVRNRSQEVDSERAEAYCSRGGCVEDLFFPGVGFVCIGGCVLRVGGREPETAGREGGESVEEGV